MAPDPKSCLEQAEARGAELALVGACLRGEPEALLRFEREFGACVRAGVAHVCADSSFVEEMVSALRVSLVSGAAPKLAAYSGRGPLGAWLRIVGSRAALDVCRSERRRQQREQNAILASHPALPEPERGLDRARYGDVFASSMRAALRRLPVRERELLLLRFREGVELEDLGARFGVHRATVQRWLVLATRALRTALSTELSRAGARLSASDFAGLGPQLISALGPAVASWLGAEREEACSQERQS